MQQMQKWLDTTINKQRGQMDGEMALTIGDDNQ
jgi:hypothetical protein